MRLIITILQVALSLLNKNPDLSAGNLCGYFPQDTLVSEAPKGYKPFYISHIARHGSRFLSDGNIKYFQATDTLAMFAEKGMLTKDGLSLMEDLLVMRGLTEGHFGDLTGLGALEHRQICSRMVRHYPEVFAGGDRSHVEAISTSSQRVIESMVSFISELSKLAPSMVVDAYKTDWGKDPRSQEVAGYEYLMTDSMEEVSKEKEKELRKLGRKITKGMGDYHVFAERIFLEPEKIPFATVKYLARSTYRVFKTGRVTEPDTMPGMDKYLTVEELYPLWASSCIGWLRYIDLPGYKSPLAETRGKGIIERIIADADEAIRSDSNAAATLRFSHDTCLLPLMGAIPLEGAILECDKMQYLDYFQDFNFICPACNVQMVFYRNKRNNILVKFLLNEKETLIHGLQPKTGCFYEWNSVKQFWAGNKSN